MLQILTFAFLNKSDSWIEPSLITKNHRQKTNSTAVPALQREIADSWKNGAEPGTSDSKCKYDHSKLTD